MVTTGHATGLEKPPLSTYWSFCCKLSCVCGLILSPAKYLEALTLKLFYSGTGPHLEVSIIYSFNQLHRKQEVVQSGATSDNPLTNPLSDNQ